MSRSKQSHLSPCPSCAIHVRVSESACPFCGVALSDAFRAQSAPRPPQRGLSRSALYAFGAGAVTLATACSSGSSQQEPSPAPMYGSPPLVDSGSDAAFDGGADTGPVALYGGPPIDAGPGPDTGPGPAYGGPPTDGGHDASDAGEPDAFPIVDAAYGGPPIDAGDQ
jgi:hypothetical protein